MSPKYAAAIKYKHETVLYQCVTILILVKQSNMVFLRGHPVVLLK